MGANRILIIILILACLGVSIYFFKNNFKTMVIPNDQVKTAKFQGTIKKIITDCFTTGACSVILESNAVITVAENPGDVSPEIREKLTGKSESGRLIGFELNEKYIGRTVEVYAKDAGVPVKSSGIHYYTLKGSREYYIKLLR